jgi:ABC-2 type transport system permease protein
MSFTVAGRSLEDSRRGLIGWSLGLIGLVGFTLAFWPSIEGNQSYDDLLKDMPEAFKSLVGTQSLASPAGYLESQLFILMLPLLFLIFGIGRGSDAIAGEEKRKTIDLLLANPIARGRVLVEKLMALAGGVAVIAVAFFVVLVLGALLLGMDVGFTDLLIPSLGTALLGIMFGALALSIGAFTGKKGVAIGATAAVATITYFLNSLAPFVEAVEPFRVLSPFYWALGGSPVGDPVPLVRLLLPVLATALIVAVGVFTFDRRDLAA